MRLLTRRLALCVLAFFSSRRAFPDSADSPKLRPEYEVTVSDGSRIRKLFRENAWMKEFETSNLFRGSMVRLGPVLYASGTSQSWKGRLIDFLAEHFLDGRAVRVSYFHSPKLVSPIGMTLPALSRREHEALRLLVGVLRSGDDVRTSVPLENGQSAEVPVTPLILRLQRFAVVETSDCLAISRDPTVAATLSRRCAPTPHPAAAVMDVDTHSFFSSWSAVLERLFGVGERLRLNFDWDEKHARFTPAGGELALEKDHLLGTGPSDAAPLQAIPADTLFFTTVFLPDPGPLSVSSVESYFRKVRTSRAARAVPISLVYLGMRSGPNGTLEALSALLVPQPPGDDRALAQVDALFNQNASYEVHASRACPGLIALSPSRKALEHIADVCAGRQPSFLQMSPKLLATFRRQPLSAGAFWNAGAFFKTAVSWGWERDRPRPEGQESQPGTPSSAATLPGELVDAMHLLDRLPMYAFAGPAVGNAVVMRGAEP